MSYELRTKSYELKGKWLTGCRVSFVSFVKNLCELCGKKIKSTRMTQMNADHMVNRFPVTG
jgi:rRNA maturation endonuclease Nob1